MPTPIKTNQSQLPPTESFEDVFLRLLLDRYRFSIQPNGSFLVPMDFDEIEITKKSWPTIDATADISDPKKSLTHMYPKLSDFSNDEPRLRMIIREKMDPLKPRFANDYMYKFFKHLNFDEILIKSPIVIGQKFQTLKKVSLNSCGITKIDPLSLQSPMLEELYLYHNRLTGQGVEIPYNRRNPTHKECTSLKFIGLGFNQLTDIEDILDWFSQLYVIDVSFNQIETLDIYSDTVVQCDLRGNPICLCENYQMLMADMLPKSVSAELVKELQSTTVPIEGPLDPVLLKVELVSFSGLEGLLPDIPSVDKIKENGLSFRIKLPVLESDSDKNNSSNQLIYNQQLLSSADWTFAEKTINLQSDLQAPDQAEGNPGLDLDTVVSRFEALQQRDAEEKQALEGHKEAVANATQEGSVLPAAPDLVSIREKIPLPSMPRKGVGKLIEPMVLFHENLPAKIWTKWILSLPKVEVGIVTKTEIEDTEAMQTEGAEESEDKKPQEPKFDIQRQILGGSHLNLFEVFSANISKARNNAEDSNKSNGISLDISSALVKTEHCDRVPFRHTGAESKDIQEYYEGKLGNIVLKCTLHEKIPVKDLESENQKGE